MYPQLVCPLSTAVATAGTADDLFVGWPDASNDAYLVAAVYAADDAVTANDTNFATVTISVGSTTLCSFTTETSASGGTGNIATSTPVIFSISNPKSALVKTTAPVKIAVTKDGSGVALTGRITLQFQPVRA